MDHYFIKVKTDQSSVSYIPFPTLCRAVHIGDSVYTWANGKLTWKRFIRRWSKGVTIGSYNTDDPWDEQGMLVVGCVGLTNVFVNDTRGKVLYNTAHGKNYLSWD